MKNVAHESDLNLMLDGSAAKENYIHEAMIILQFFPINGGIETLTENLSNLWDANYKRFWRFKS